jgi:eukaryotic-like serine/threonine-protein kinase
MNQSSPESTFDVLDVGDLGRYRLIARLARGGMGDIYLAVQRGPSGFSKLTVLKELRDTLAPDPACLEMFLEEARLAARLNHPNVVQTNEVDSDGARHFIAMEYLDGQPLHRIMSRLARTGELSLPMRLRILADALAGLHYAHELCDFDGSPLHVVHRDVSPQNVLVTYEGAVKVLDFGIAKSLVSEETRAGIVKGKAAYMAPEQAMGRPVDRRADVFSAGVMLWELVTNQRLWKGLTEVAVLLKISSGQVPSPRDVAPDVPDELVRICERALAREPQDRYDTALALRTDIERFLSSLASPVSNSEIGHILSTTFAAERARLRLLVENEARRVRSTSTGEFRALDLTGLTRAADEMGATSPGSTIARGRVASAIFASAITRARTPSSSFAESLAPTSVDAPFASHAAATALAAVQSRAAIPVQQTRTAGVVLQGAIIGASIGLVLVFLALVAPLVGAVRGPDGNATNAATIAEPSGASEFNPIVRPVETPLGEGHSASDASVPANLAAHGASNSDGMLDGTSLRHVPAPMAHAAPWAPRASAVHSARADVPASVHAAPEPPPSAVEPPLAQRPPPPPPSVASPPQQTAFSADMMRPKFVAGQDPIYTREALLARVQGTMIAKCTITTTGTLEGCRVLKALPHMEQALLESLRTRRYTPIIYQGRPTAVEYVINIQLVLPN